MKATHGGGGGEGRGEERRGEVGRKRGAEKKTKGVRITRGQIDYSHFTILKL